MNEIKILTRENVIVAVCVVAWAVGELLRILGKI